MTYSIPYLESMTSAFGDTAGRVAPSRGISVAPGALPFPSWVPGRVARVAWDSALGNVVVVQNADDGARVMVAHLADIRVAVGDQVEVGDVLGTIGETGTGCLGRCAYIAVLVDGQFVDPVTYAAGGER